MQNLYSNPRIFPLATLVLKTSRTDCSDPRDVIYSLLGTIGNYAKDIETIYSTPVSVYSSESRETYIIERYQSLAVLAAFDYAVKGLPS